MNLTLYGYYRSSASWRVRIALALKGLPYTSIPVHLVRDGGEQHHDAYRALNPMREVPTLDVDGVPVAQSIAIIELLNELAPDPPLLPESPLGRAHVRQVAEVINASIQPVQNLRVLQKLDADFGAGTDGKAAWAAHWIRSGFDGLEPLIARHAGAYAYGDQITIADLCLVPQVYNARRFNVDLAPYPTIHAVDARLAEHPAFITAHPEAQPDAPGKNTTVGSGGVN